MLVVNETDTEDGGQETRRTSLKSNLNARSVRAVTRPSLGTPSSHHRGTISNLGLVQAYLHYAKSPNCLPFPFLQQQKNGLRGGLVTSITFNFQFNRNNCCHRFWHTNLTRHNEKRWTLPEKNIYFKKGFGLLMLWFFRSFLTSSQKNKVVMASIPHWSIQCIPNFTHRFLVQRGGPIGGSVFTSTVFKW